MVSEAHSAMTPTGSRDRQKTLWTYASCGHLPNLLAAPLTSWRMLIVVGGMNDDRYEARCRAHHVVASARGLTSPPIWDELPHAYE